MGLEGQALGLTLEPHPEGSQALHTGVILGGWAALEACGSPHAQPGSFSSWAFLGANGGSADLAGTLDKQHCHLIGVYFT